MRMEKVPQYPGHLDPLPLTNFTTTSAYDWKPRRSISPLLISLFLITALLFNSKVYAQSIVRLEATTGAEWSNLKWAVAGNSNGSSPNIFSELKWRELSGINYNLSAAFKNRRMTYFFRTSFSPNLEGNVEDTDYGGDNRTNVQYQEVFSSNGGRMLRAETGVKVDLQRSNSMSVLQIKAGIRYRNQRLFLDQELNTVHSYYNSRWGGIFLGIEKSVLITDRIEMYLSAAADLSDYDGYGNWELRTDLAHPKSFIHNAKGYGVNAGFKTDFQINRTMAITTNIEGWYTDTFIGKDILYFNDGSSIPTQLNGVSSLALNASLGFTLTF